MRNTPQTLSVLKRHFNHLYLLPLNSKQSVKEHLSEAPEGTGVKAPGAGSDLLAFWCGLSLDRSLNLPVPTPQLRNTEGSPVPSKEDSTLRSVKKRPFFNRNLSPKSKKSKSME